MKKRVGYCVKNGKIVEVFKVKGKKGRKFKNGDHVRKGTRCYTKKMNANKALRSKMKGKTRRRKKRSSSFGVGGSYMPLSSFMSPYPYAVDSSPPWI